MIQSSERARKGPFLFYEVGELVEFGGGVTGKKTALKGGHLKKIREKGGSPKILPLLEGGSWEKI